MVPDVTLPHLLLYYQQYMRIVDQGDQLLNNYNLDRSKNGWNDVLLIFWMPTFKCLCSGWTSFAELATCLEGIKKNDILFI